MPLWYWKCYRTTLDRHVITLDIWEYLYYTVCSGVYGNAAVVERHVILLNSKFPFWCRLLSSTIRDDDPSSRLLSRWSMLKTPFNELPGGTFGRLYTPIRGELIEKRHTQFTRFARAGWPGSPVGKSNETASSSANWESRAINANGETRLQSKIQTE